MHAPEDPRADYRWPGCDVIPQWWLAPPPTGRAPISLATPAGCRVSSGIGSNVRLIASPDSGMWVRRHEQMNGGSVCGVRWKITCPAVELKVAVRRD
jgi:hypothetical protein